MTERAPHFDAAVVVYEAAQARLLALIDRPEKHLTVAECRAHIQDALKHQQRAHKAMMEAWA